MYVSGKEALRQRETQDSEKPPHGSRESLSIGDGFVFASTKRIWNVRRKSIAVPP